MQPAEYLNFIPDFAASWKAANQWIEEGKQKIKLLTQQAALDAEYKFLDWPGFAEMEMDPHFGYYVSESWRKFVLSLFLSDLVSYPVPAHQVDFARLLFVTHQFPQGFRTCFIKLKDNTWFPVGYTGWYPMDEISFTIMEKSPETLKDRMVKPVSLQEFPYLYLFNYSVASICKKTPLSKALMLAFVGEVKALHPKAMSCITVSEDGVRIAKQFGMHHSGNLHIQGSIEGVYTS